MSRRHENALRALPTHLSLRSQRSSSWASLFDFPGNLQHIRQWRDDQKNIYAITYLIDQLQQARVEIDRLFKEEAAARQSVVDALAAIRLDIDQSAGPPDTLPQDRLRQVCELAANARSVTDHAAQVLKDAPEMLAAPPDDGVCFSLAHFSIQLATLYRYHAGLLVAVLKESDRINETALLDRLDRIYPDYILPASLPVEPAWSNLQPLGAHISSHLPRLDAVQSELQKQIEESSKYWQSLNALLSEIAVEIQRIQTAEAALVPYLGSLEDVPQAWERASGVVGSVSGQLKTLRQGLQTFTHSIDARRPTPQNWSIFQLKKDSFLKLKAAAQSLQNKWDEVQRDQNRLASRFEPEGSAATLIARLQKAIDDGLSENKDALKDQIYHFYELKSELTPHRGVSYLVLSDRLDRLEAEARKTLSSSQAQLERKRQGAAGQWANYQSLRARYLHLKDRTPHADKDWSTVERWVTGLTRFNLSTAAPRDIDVFQKAYQQEVEKITDEIVTVESFYNDFDGQVADAIDNCNKSGNNLALRAKRIEDSYWRQMFFDASQALREGAVAFGQLGEYAQIACDNPEMDAAIQMLKQITRKSHRHLRSGERGRG